MPHTRRESPAMPADGLDLILAVPPASSHAARAALPAWLDALRQARRDFGVTVVDDGTPEGLADLAGGPVAVLRHETPRGFGACLRAGLAAGVAAGRRECRVRLPVHAGRLGRDAGAAGTG